MCIRDRSGIQHMRLYIMIGLPTETDEDIEAIVGLAERTQAHMAEVGCKGRLTLSINPFIPKPFTPFQLSLIHILIQPIKVIKGKLRKRLHSLKMQNVRSSLPVPVY